jgi:WD40 repeat protein
VQLWQLGTGQSRTTLWPPAQVAPAPAAAALVSQIRADEPFTAVAFSPDGQLIAAGTGNRWVVIFQASTGQVVSIIQAYPELANLSLLHPMEFIAVSPNNQWLLTNSFESLKLWHLPERRLIQDFSVKSIQNVPFYPQRGVFTPDSTQVWLFADGGFPITATPSIWSLERQALLPAAAGLAPSSEGFTLPAHAISTAISADRQLLAFGGGIYQDPANYGSSWWLKNNDTRILVWRVGQDQPLYILREHTDNIMDLAFSPDSHFLASVSVDSTLRLWRLENI